MLSIVERLFSIPWTILLARFSQFRRSHLAYIFSSPLSPCNLRPLTDQQRKDKRDEFIDSIDKDAICALASKYNGDLPCSIRCQSRGSFNVCFVLDFSNGTTRSIRLPIEPAVRDAWDKVCSEVYTMQYVLDHTNIPLPRVYAYGRSRLRRDTPAYQVFMVMDYIDGERLTAKMLRDSSEDRRYRFLGEVVDVFAQLRRLEFPRGGSLMPNATVGIWARLWTFMRPKEQSFTPKSTLGLKSGRPNIVGAFSMRKNELQVDGYIAPRTTATTANEFFTEQYHLLQDMWTIPVQELDRDEAEREQFALHAFSFEEAQRTLGFEAGGSFCLTHPDPRMNNIIVDDDLHIRGIIDWEFSVIVPQQAFLPPSWINGLDIGSIPPSLSSEFIDVLSSRKELSSGHSQLAQDWKFQDDLMLPMAYILLDPSNLSFVFYRYIYPKLFTEPRDSIVPRFFQRPENKELEAGVVRRLRACERYTQYLKDHNIFDDTEQLERQKLQRSTAEIQELLQKLREDREKDEDKLRRWGVLPPIKEGEGPSVPGTS